MATRKELVEAIRLIKDHCEEYDSLSCRNECPLISVCAGYFVIPPANWVILEGRDAVDEIEAEGGKSMTNADRIRQMTDEELALYLVWTADQDTLIVDYRLYECHDRSIEDTLDWLKQEG